MMAVWLSATSTLRNLAVEKAPIICMVRVKGSIRPMGLKIVPATYIIRVAHATFLVFNLWRVALVEQVAESQEAWVRGKGCHVRECDGEHTARVVS
jgi:hypothetical protein